MKPGEFLAAEDARARKEQLQKNVAALPQAQPLIPLPEEAMALWRKRYEEELEDGLRTYPERRTVEHHAAAIREANRMIFRVAPVESLEEARALPTRQIVRREERDASGGGRELLIVTLDAKKYVFPIPVR